jgi:hypothetical protein
MISLSRSILRVQRALGFQLGQTIQVPVACGQRHAAGQGSDIFIHIKDFVRRHVRTRTEIQGRITGYLDP